MRERRSGRPFCGGGKSGNFKCEFYDYESCARLRVLRRDGAKLVLTM